MKICGSQLVGKVLGFFLMWHFCSNGHAVNGQMVKLDSAEVSNNLQTLTLRICFTDAQIVPGTIFFSAAPNIFGFSSQQPIQQLMIDNNQQCGDYIIPVDIQLDQIGMDATVELVGASPPLQVSQSDGDDSHTVTIPGVFFDFAAYSAQEGISPVMLSICRFPLTEELLTTLMSIDGTAVANSDYTALQQLVQIQRGVRCATESITINDDDIIEGTETFTVSVSIIGPSSLIVSSSRGAATVTIMDDDIGVFFEPIVYSVSEDDTFASLTICRLPSTASLMTTLMSINGTAESGSDFIAFQQSVQIHSGVQCATTSIGIIDDEDMEGNETFTVSVSISQPSSLMVSPSQGTATVTIMDDDIETVSVILERPSFFPNQVTSRANNMLSFNLPVRAVSGDIIGTNLWMVDVFLSSDMMGQGSNLEFGAAALEDDALNMALSSGMTATLSNLEINLDLTFVFCAQIPYVCVRLRRNQNSSPFFILMNSNGGGDVIHCRTIVCHETVAVTLGIPSFIPSLITSEENNNILEFDLPVTSHGAGISGMNLWMVEVFLSSSSSGQDNKLASATATLPNTAMDQGIDPLGMSTLSSLQVNLDVTNLSCDRFSYICVNLSRNPSSDPVFVLVNSEGGNSILQCQTIGCQASPCISDPCQNGGTCFVVRNDVHCVCEDGFFGDTCGNVLVLNCPSDLRIITDVGKFGAVFDLGMEINCSSDLSCKLDNTSITDLSFVSSAIGQREVSCECGRSLGGHQTSKMCSFPVTVIVHPCNSDPCDENAECTLDEETFKCTCDDGFTGDGEKSGSGCTACSRTSSSVWMYGPDCSLPCTCAYNVSCDITFGVCSGACDEHGPFACDKNNLDVTIANGSVTVNEKETFSLLCEINLGPNDVTVTWKDRHGNITQSDLNTETMISTLTITDATAKDDGEYTCTATLKAPTNNLTSVSDSVDVNVKVQGKIDRDFEVLKEGNVGENIILTCQAFGNPQPDVTWLYKNGTIFSNNTMQSDKPIVSEPLCCDVTRELQFMGLTNANNGTYTCNVTVDGVVTDSRDVDLIVIDFPEIANLKIAGSAATSLTVSWQVIDYGQDDLNCTASYSGSNGRVITHCEKDERCEVQDLTPNTEYIISVVCYNNAGPSNTEHTTGRTIRSTPDIVPALQLADTANSVNSTSIVVELSDDISEDNGEIRCYEFVVAVDSPSDDPDDDYPFNKVLDQSGVDELPYRAVVMNRSTFIETKKVVIGMASPSDTSCELTNPTAKRKRRALIPPQTLTARNDPLKSEQAYNIFLRVYVPSGESYDYESSDYMDFVTAKAPSGSNPGAIIAVLIILIIIIIVLVVVVLFIYRKRRAESEHGIINGEIMALQENGINGHKEDKVGQDNPAFEIEKVEPINIDELGNQILEKHQNNSRIFNAEFRSLLDVNPDTTFETFSHPANAEKNRYINIYCYDHSRVKLEEIEDVEHSDYINANYIDGYNVSNKFIAAQGPKSETVEDHWRMLWQQNTATVIMLTRCFEDGGREKCAQYWPDKGSQTFGVFTVHLDSVAECPDYVIRKFRVTKEGEEEGTYHTVTQFHYLAWPDHGVPEYPYKMLAFIKRIRQMTPAKPEKGNIVVHCSAGVGRTGTYITIDAMLDRLREEKTVDIYNFIQSMRLNRRLLVQTVVQYIFIYHALHEEHLYGHTEIDLADLHHYFRRLRLKTHSEDNSPLHNEFKTAATLPVKDTNSSEASVQANIEKNRTRNYLPYDRNRVKLERLVGDENSTYINASYINGYERKNMYITTQAPMENTTHDFWRMVWESLTSTIVMLTDLEEKGNEMCVKFWPEEEAKTFGSLTVELTSENEEDDYTTMEFNISNTEGVATRKVKMYRFHGWPEVGAPKCCEAVCDLVNVAHEHQRQAEREESAEQSKHPIVVFCHTGVGRTAVWVALAILMERARAEGVVDVFQTVRTLRQQRQHMIQDATQYEFLYEAVLRHLDTLDQYANFR